MTAVKAVEVSDQPQVDTPATSAINWYPLLGICLATLAAALAYGSIYFALLAD
ncbi:hypothetical protein ACSUZJ_12370 [Telluria sp. B2]